MSKLRNGHIEGKAVKPTGKISDAFGLLKRDNGLSLSVEEINRIAGRGWAATGEDDRRNPIRLSPP